MSDKVLIVAKSAGFCFGVNRAISALKEESAKSPVATLGPIIHNNDVVERLSERGGTAIDSIDDLPCGARVAIRTHGVDKATVDAIEKSGSECIDLTCPFVKKIHKIVLQQLLVTLEQ